MDIQYESLTERYSSKPEGYYEIQRPEMLPFIPDGVSSMLEVGCSSGGFGKLVKARRSSCEIWGIEPSPAAAAVASKRLDNTICGIFKAGMPELEGKQFDCIVFNDVLEHLVNPDQVLQDSKQYLSKTGVVVASIPNILHFYQIMQILIRQDWKYEAQGILDNTHLRFFTKKSIIRLFEESGYEVELIRGINASVGLKYKVANAITFGHLIDWKYVQFGVRARVA